MWILGLVMILAEVGFLTYVWHVHGLEAIPMYVLGALAIGISGFILVMQ